MSHLSQLLINETTDASVGYHSCEGGGRMRYAMLWPKGEPRGTLLIAPGRREFIEKKYREVGEEFLKRGYRIILFEWRGQGLSDRFLDGEIRHRDYVTDFSILLQDLTGFYEGVVKPNQIGPLILCGHSMGSHLFLRWLMEKTDSNVSAAILSAPMVAMAGSVIHGSANLLCWSAIKLGYGSDYAPSQHDYDSQDKIFTGNPLTHDPVRYALMEKYFKAYPEMTVSGVTWEWLHAAIKSMQCTQRRADLELIRIPVLTLTGSQDRVTPYGEIQHYLDMIPRAENTLIGGALHDVMNETDACRVDAWNHIDRFLARNVGKSA